MEVLAPCGNREAFKSAILANADAVYLGLKQFSSRGNAENFDFDDLLWAIKESRLVGMKVYVALNTIIFDDEIPILREHIKKISNIIVCDVKTSVDAVIVQDLGVATIVGEVAPELPIHASTQMTITSQSGVKALLESGLNFRRVVLSRELSESEIRSITDYANKIGIETEVFVHGAHCVSISGQCYMSGLLGGRSGNRGVCAQPCRLDFCNGDKHYVLSLKDLSIIKHIPKLIEMGVSCVKIEGRMKRPEYVAAAVDACKKAVNTFNRDIDKLDLTLLGSVFSRSGFSDGYFINDYSNMEGIRTREDVKSSKNAIIEIQERFKTPPKHYVVDFFIRVKTNEPIYCMASVGDVISKTEGATPEKALNKVITSDIIKKQFSKLGETVFELGKIECEIEGGLMLKISDINSLRRDSIEKLSKKVMVKNCKTY